MATEDARREKSQEKSLTTLLLQDSSVGHRLRRKATGEQHIRTGAAWLRRIENMRLDDLKDALQNIKTLTDPSQTGSQTNSETQPSIPSDETRAEAAPVSLSHMQADENGQFMEVEEPNHGRDMGDQGTVHATHEDQIDLWYNNEISKLRVQQSLLREEQFRRRRASLRAEYWYRMDAKRNNVTPSIISFS